MSKQMILGTVLGGIVLFVWGAIAWMFIPWPGQPLRAFKNEDAVMRAWLSKTEEQLWGLRGTTLSQRERE